MPLIALVTPAHRKLIYKYNRLMSFQCIKESGKLVEIIGGEPDFDVVFVELFTVRQR